MATSELNARTSDNGSALPTPDVLLFDVYGTLSDLSPLGSRFVDVGAPADLAPTWLTTLLLHGFALTAAHAPAHFQVLAFGTLRASLEGLTLNRGIDEAVAHIMGGFDELDLHSDVAAGLPALGALGPRLVTLSNSQASADEQLLERAGVSGHFERQLSTEDSGIWKPAPAAYAYAAGRCRSRVAAMMLVAVHPWDIDGAHRAGLRTAWINRTGSTYPVYFNAPEVQATSLTHLADLLGA